MRAGATYYSDEYALVDDAGRVLPYPRALSLRRARGAVRVRPERLGKVGRAPLPVGLVVVCRFAARTKLAPLSPGRALLAILKQTVAARAQAATAMERLSRIVTTAPVVAGTRGEARDFARALLDGTHLDTSLDRWTTARSDGGGGRSPRATSATPTLKRRTSPSRSTFAIASRPVPITRLDSRQAEIALMTTVAYAA